MAFGDKIQSASGTTSATFGGTPVAGNLLVFLAASTANVVFTAPTGFTGGTARNQSGGSALGAQLSWKLSAGTETGAISPASGTATYCCLVELQGPFTSPPLDVQGSQINAAQQQQPSPSVAPATGVQRLAVGAAMQDGTAQTWTEGSSGFTNLSGALSEDIDAKGQIAHQLGSFSSTTVYTGFSDSAIAGVGMIAIFTPAAALAPEPLIIRQAVNRTATY
jgi:hypothetical protein